MRSQGNPKNRPSGHKSAQEKSISTQVTDSFQVTCSPQVTDSLHTVDLLIERDLERKVTHATLGLDPAHDILHIKRVVKKAKEFCIKEKACIEVVVPAAWLHDLVLVKKNDTRRKQASVLSAEAAIDFLKELGYPEKFFDHIYHAIVAHSFSGGIEPKTLEACIVQDADRIDALGAVGIARCFATAGLLKRSFYSEEDPFCKNRFSNDQLYTLDHFFIKLFKIVESLKTQSAHEEGQKRLKIMKQYLEDLSSEIS
jgi:uncharacterized protein